MFRYSAPVEGIFDAYLASLTDEAAAELASHVGLFALDHDSVWRVRHDADEVVRTLRTINDIEGWPIREQELEPYDKLAEASLEGQHEIRELIVYRYWNVVESVQDPLRELDLESAMARLPDDDCEVGDELGFRELEATRSLRLEFFRALARRTRFEFVDEASAGEEDITQWLDSLATEVQSRADIATQLAGSALFWRWSTNQPAWEMTAAQRQEICQFCSAVLRRSDAPINDPIGHRLSNPDLATVRGLFRWLQRHRRRDHFRGRRR